MQQREHEFRSVLFECGGVRRFTQDSPILPDVWLAYDTPGDPFADEQDLLLTPHYGGLAGRAAKALREQIAEARKDSPRAVPRIAQLPGIIAARLYLDELLQIVLPQTKWWQAEAERFDATLLEDEQFDRLLVELERDRRCTDPAAHKGETLPLPTGFAWLLHVVAFMIAEKTEPTREQHVEACRHVFGERGRFLDLAKRKEPSIFGVVAINRKAEPAAAMDSVLAVKADAARLLFNVSCASITWAVIDSGIDSDHPAFAVRDTATGAPTGANRIVGTYDLTLVRELLDPFYINSLFEEGAKLDERQQEIKARYLHNLEGRKLEAKAAPRLARQLSERLEAGFELDWGLIEPFLWVEKPVTPPRSHGTMVAGILGADWREPEGVAAGKEAEAGRNPGLDATGGWTVRMQGICPDIRLYDMRVIGEDEDSREFELLAALQLIRHLNEQSDRREIHGANLSLSTEHDVTSYACGSTLVCQECDRTWASGVVLVAAAGNRGHQHYMLAGGAQLGGYHGMSITDPGNAEGVITVGATHRANPHQYGVSYFSSRGPTGDGRLKPDLVAPGEKVTGPVPHCGETTDDGTSFAAPHVSGAAAMLMARHSELIGRPQRIKEILRCTATDLGRERYFQGAGMVDILRALQSV